MEQEPAAQHTSETPWDRMDRAFRTVLGVPKEALLKEEAKLKGAKANKPRSPKKPS